MKLSHCLLNFRAWIKALHVKIDTRLQYRAWCFATKGNQLHVIGEKDWRATMNRLQFADGCMGLIDDICHKCETKHLRNKIGQCLITYRALSYFDVSTLPLDTKE